MTSHKIVLKDSSLSMNRHADQQSVTFKLSNPSPDFLCLVHVRDNFVKIIVCCELSVNSV